MEMNKSREEMMRKKFLMIFVGDSIKDDPFCILKKLDELLSSDKQ